MLAWKSEPELAWAGQLGWAASLEPHPRKACSLSTCLSRFRSPIKCLKRHFFVSLKKTKQNKNKESHLLLLITEMKRLNNENIFQNNFRVLFRNQEKSNGTIYAFSGIPYSHFVGGVLYHSRIDSRTSQVQVSFLLEILFNQAC